MGYYNVIVVLFSFVLCMWLVDNETDGVDVFCCLYDVTVEWFGQSQFTEMTEWVTPTDTIIIIYTHTLRAMYIIRTTHYNFIDVKHPEILKLQKGTRSSYCLRGCSYNNQSSILKQPRVQSRIGRLKCESKLLFMRQINYTVEFLYSFQYF